MFDNAAADKRPRRKRAFLHALADTVNVARACRKAGIPRRTAYDWRDADPDFARRWNDALDDGIDLLEAELHRRAFEGVEKPVWHKGEQVGTTRHYSDALAMFLLKAHRPERYRDNYRPPAPEAAAAGADPAAATREFRGAVEREPLAAPAVTVTDVPAGAVTATTATAAHVPAAAALATATVAGASGRHADTGSGDASRAANRDGPFPDSMEAIGYDPMPGPRPAAEGGIMERVGYVGLGVMGTPMSSNLVRKGFDVTVFDVDRSRMPPLVALGASGAESVAEVAENSDVVITMLPGSPEVMDVVSGPGGVVESGRPGTVVLDTSTIYPGDTDALAEAAKAAGMTFMDAAVGRLPPQAIAGASMFMVGGEAEDVARVRPLLEAMGDAIVHCGPVGAGIRCKVVNNFLTMITAKANAEAFSMAMKAGLPADAVWRVITGTTATNGCLSTGWLPKLFAGDLEPGFAMRLARKDLALGVRLADELGVDAPLADLALAHYDGLLESKYADKDFSAIVSAACEAAGVEDPILDRPRP